MDKEYSEGGFIDKNRVNGFSDEIIDILRYRGFHAEYPCVLDDIFYKEQGPNRLSFLESRISIEKLLIMSPQQMKHQLFEKDSVYPQEVCFRYGQRDYYEFFVSEKAFYDVRPDCLDPYIARYIRAINRCGIRTFYSCDGWHKSVQKSKEVTILFDDRYNWIWHQLLCEDKHIKAECNWEHLPDSSGGIARILLPSTDQGKKEIYKKINLMAEKIEAHLNYFQMLKMWIRAHINPYHIDSLEDQEAKETLQRAIEDLYTELDTYKILT